MTQPDIAAIVLPIGGTILVAVAGFALRAQSRQIAREESEAKTKELEERIPVMLRGELAAFKVDLMTTLNGTYTRTPAMDAKFATVNERINGLVNILEIRPCIAHGRHRIDGNCKTPD